MVLLLGGFMPIGSSTPLVSQFLDTVLATAGMNVLGGNVRPLWDAETAADYSCWRSLWGKNTKLAKNHPDRMEKTTTNVI